MHCDKANNFEYDVSCILYLNDEGADFTGGEFVFMDTIPAHATISLQRKKKDGYSSSGSSSGGGGGFNSPAFSSPRDISDIEDNEAEDEIVYSICKSEEGVDNSRDNETETEHPSSSSSSSSSSCKNKYGDS